MPCLRDLSYPSITVITWPPLHWLYCTLLRPMCRETPTLPADKGRYRITHRYLLSSQGPSQRDNTEALLQTQWKKAWSRRQQSGLKCLWFGTSRGGCSHSRSPTPHPLPIHSPPHPLPIFPKLSWHNYISFYGPLFLIHIPLAFVTGRCEV